MDTGTEGELKALCGHGAVCRKTRDRHGQGEVILENKPRTRTRSNEMKGDSIPVPQKESVAIEKGLMDNEDAKFHISGKGEPPRNTPNI